MITVSQISRSGGGVPKNAIESTAISVNGLQGDDQNDKRHHGGVERAVCLYSQELLDQLKTEGHPIYPGATGENLTLAGMPLNKWEQVVPGARLTIGGQVELEITSYTAPCTTIKHYFLAEKFIRISQKVNPGWSRVYARVLTPGVVMAGDEVTLQPKKAVV